MTGGRVPGGREGREGRRWRPEVDVKRSCVRPFLALPHATADVKFAFERLR